MPVVRLVDFVGEDAVLPRLGGALDAILSRAGGITPLVETVR